MSQEHVGESNRTSEQIEIHLKYEGPDVDDGKMSLQDVIPVLQGFSGAYAKLASTHIPNSTHNLRISTVRPGSADIVLEVWETIENNKESISPTLSGIAALSNAFGIVATIAKVIQIKRGVKKMPFEERISANNSIVIVADGDVRIESSLLAYEVFKEGEIDKDLELITRPLVEGKIDAAEIEATSGVGNAISERITVEERPYFEMEDLAVTSTQMAQIIVTLNSLTKTTNSGFLHLTDGSRVFYRYQGEDPHRLHTVFGTHGGPVKVRCEAKMDENLRVISVDIYEVEAFQGSIFDDFSSNEKSGIK